MKFTSTKEHALSIALHRKTNWFPSVQAEQVQNKERTQDTVAPTPGIRVFLGSNPIASLRQSCAQVAESTDTSGHAKDVGKHTPVNKTHVLLKQMQDIAIFV